jgi:hypothetical protein
MTQTDLCPYCPHPAHKPGAECEGGVDHGPKRWHRCLCLNRPFSGGPCHPLMDCQGGSLGYSDVWNLQRGQSLQGVSGEVITPDVLKTAPAVVSPPAGWAAVLLEAANALEEWQPEFSDRWAVAERQRYEDGIDAAADRLRRLAGEVQQDEPTESVIYEVVGDWGVDSADSAEGARAAVAKWLRAYPKCGAHAQQRVYREWPDGSEFYGPWTNLPEQPAAVARSGQPETDTLPAWLYQRFFTGSTTWENADPDQQAYWEHQARAVRRAVARNGFKASQPKTDREEA